MKKVWAASDNIYSPLGTTSAANFDNIRQKISGVTSVDDVSLAASPVFVSRIETTADAPHTYFESIGIRSVSAALEGARLPADRTLFILSTTKGNIRLLEESNTSHPRLRLHDTAKYIAGQFGFINTMVVSNACISGVLGIIVARRYLLAGAYDHAVVLGADVLSRFVVSGFQSLQALSQGICKPFDANRNGINLGEAAATIVLTTRPEYFPLTPDIVIRGGGASNDSNHISGPSRTGEELAFAMDQALTESDIPHDQIDFISAHGTATRYNDEMEALAFDRMRMSDIPVNSVKGNIGHTLGAAGVVETILCKHSLLRNEILPTTGFATPGVSKNITIVDALLSVPLEHCLKTASGFGGCNAAVVLSKQHHA